MVSEIGNRAAVKQEAQLSVYVLYTYIVIFKRQFTDSCVSEDARLH
jgi:hypothetical protein